MNKISHKCQHLIPISYLNLVSRKPLQVFFFRQRSWAVTWKAVVSHGLSVGETSSAEKLEELVWELLLLQGPWNRLTAETIPAREEKELLLGSWGDLVSGGAEGPGLTASFMSRARLADTIAHREQVVSLTFGKNYSFNSERERWAVPHAHRGKIFSRLLAPAKHNCPDLHGTLYCRANTQYLGYCWAQSTSRPFFQPTVICWGVHSTAECPEILDVELRSLLHILFFSRCATSQLLSVWIWRSPGKGLAESKHPQLCNHGGAWRTDQAPQVQRWFFFFWFVSFFPSPKSEICKWSNWHMFLLFYQNTSWCQVELRWPGSSGIWHQFATQKTQC